MWLTAGGAHDPSGGGETTGAGRHLGFGVLVSGEVLAARLAGTGVAAVLAASTLVALLQPEPHPAARPGTLPLRPAWSRR